ncbi:MAG TPA: isoprenylcysteine carboxylmethyltransferase family protein [Candidatus Binataceae bacterium]|nr:isoprenylcysteine carboxylmethyltransferase family protein [Candidatus Binataceae bacterium]
MADQTWSSPSAAVDPQPDVGATAPTMTLGEIAPQLPRAAAPSISRGLMVRLAELLILMAAIVGAMALGLGLSAYLREHRFITAYLFAYGVFRLADLMVRDAAALELDREGFSRRMLYELVLLVFFFAAPFERTYIYGGEPPDWSQGLGLLISLIGLWMVLAARIQLGFFMPTTGASGEPVLVRNGLYRLIRHPIYFGEFVVLFGWPLEFGAPITLVLGSIVGILVMAQRISVEEADLAARFGDEYAAYQQVTYKCIPNLW